MTTIYSNTSTATMAYVTYYIYVGEGLLLMLLNFPLALLIFLTPVLRTQKEFIIFACSMIFDGIFGFTYFYCGVFRLIVFYTDKCKACKRSDMNGTNVQVIVMRRNRK